jgi:bacillithiol biosynthesis cysteine-adding enzyme BshC
LGRAFSSAFFAGEATARRFLPFDFRDAADRQRRTRAAGGRRASDALIQILRAQQAALSPSPARAAALDALAAGGTAVVATGQQVGLFLGPLYGFYKAASAVAVARALEAESGVRCVPLFWLQTEDHDFDEIASVSVATGDGGSLRLTLAAGAGAGTGVGSSPRASVATRRLGAEVSSLVDQLAEALGPAAAASDTVDILRRHYQPERPIAAAFAGAMAELFADDGLLFFDPRDARVAALAAPIHRRAVSAAGELAQRLQERGAALAAAGFDEQIPCRPDCALSFFHPDGPDGDRFRLARRSDVPGAWGLSGRDDVIPPDALDAALAREPLRFSTSALLRPILQDSLLPTAAYVGGPAEVSYFAQLGPIYDAFELTAPLVVPRTRFRCVDAPTRRRLAALGLDADDVGRGRGPARPAGISESAALARAARQHIVSLVDGLTADAAAVAPGDRNLVRAAARTRASVARALERLTTRAERTAAVRDEVAAARLARVEAALCPGGVPQERAYGWPSLAGRIGPAELKRLVFARLAETGPFTASLLDLRP